MLKFPMPPPPHTHTHATISLFFILCFEMCKSKLPLTNQIGSAVHVLGSCVLAGALTVSEASLSAHKDTLYLAYQQTVNGLNNYKSSTPPYDYVLELSR